MAYFTKDQYEGKREWAYRRMAENAKIPTLTEEQHEALEKIASKRHDLHTSGGGDVYRMDFKGYADFLGSEFTDSQLEDIIKDNNLPDFMSKLKIDFDTFYDEDWNEREVHYDGKIFEEDIDVKDERYLEKRDIIGNETAVNVGILDQSLRNYLKYIDEIFGTNYSPSRGDSSDYKDIEKQRQKYFIP